MNILGKRINIVSLIKILISIFFINIILVTIILVKVVTINYEYANNNYDLKEIHKEALKIKEEINKKDYVYNNNYYNVKYIDNYDGDTAKFEINLYKKGNQEIIIKENVRFKNINAEEIRNKNKEKKSIAIKQKEELRNKLLNAKQIDLLNCEKEKYGRLLCEVRVVD